MLNYLLQNPPDLLGFLIVALIFVVALSLHEFGHAAAATAQGDPTARLAGRLTINPRAHLDPLGTVMLVLVGFGWGKPVPFAPNKLRSERFGAAAVGLAGPLVNVILAFVSAAALVNALSNGSGDGLVARTLFISLRLNIVLALFNLLPIPPLDGSRVLSVLLPPSKHHIIYFLDKWGFVLLLLLVFLVFPSFAGPVVGAAMGLILNVVGA